MLKSTLLKKTLLILTFFFIGANNVQAIEITRFFYMGDGIVSLKGQKIIFRNPDGTYRDAGLKQINQIFRSPWLPAEERLSLRFIEILDYVQDKLKGRTYSLRSGYRSPRGNQSLRKRGKLAAQSSMHVEAAAGDLTLNGVPSSQVFDFVKALDCCGIGWYHSRHFHLDTGPSRYWSEKTSKTEDKRPQLNAKIIMQSDFDRYLPGERLPLKYMRVTNYPIGVPQIVQLVSTDQGSEFKPKNLTIQFPENTRVEDHCRILSSRKQARNLSTTLPKKDLPAGKYALKISFCNRYDYETMPTEILSRPFEITQAVKGN